MLLSAADIIFHGFTALLFQHDPRYTESQAKIYLDRYLDETLIKVLFLFAKH